jgi:hypothetical protein
LRYRRRRRRRRKKKKKKKNFLWLQRRHNCSPAVSFANCVMTLYLLKVHLQTFLSKPTTQKCQILSLDTLVAKWAICFGQTYCPSSGVLILYS